VVEPPSRPIGYAQRLGLAEQRQKDEEDETRQSLGKPPGLTREDVAADDELRPVQRPLKGRWVDRLSRSQPRQPREARSQLGHELLVLVERRDRSERLPLPVLSVSFGAARIGEIVEDFDQAPALDAVGGVPMHCCCCCCCCEFVHISPFP
jgi:hypothetical protein